jgi:V8-like Glu-specific endopeptidase
MATAFLEELVIKAALIALVGLSFFSTNAMALPVRQDFSDLVAPVSLTSNYNFEGIVALSNCSGGIVRFEHSRETDRAMILTNGHCLETGFPTPGTSVFQKPSTRKFKVLDSNASVLGTIQATKVMYSAMTRTDIALYEVQETFAEILEKFKVHALVLSSQHPKENEPIEVISGYWQRGYTCKIEAFVPQLKEDVFTFVDSIRYSRPGCDVIGGTSGSPIVLKGSRLVLGVNNTINQNGQSCTMNNPCEVDQNGNVAAHQGVGYAQQSYWIYTCLDAEKNLDLSTPGCLLQR